MADQSQGNDPPEGSQGDDAPKFVTEEQLNRAISARLGSFEKKQEKTFGDFSTKLEAMLKPPPTQEGGGTGGNAGDPLKQPDESPAMKALQRQLDETKKLAERLASEKDAETKKSKDTRLRQAVQEKLSTAGILGPQIKHATGYLIDAQKAVRFNEDDELLFRDGADELPLDDGIASWLKSDDAKIYLPPRGTTGSGDRPTSNVRGSSAPSADDQLRQAVIEHFGIK